MNNKLEVALAVLVVLTLFAVLAERFLFKKHAVIEPSANLPISVYSDAVVGGNSNSEVLNASGYAWRCTLKAHTEETSYCSFELLLRGDWQNGMNLRGYDHIKLWLDYEGPAETLRLYLRNYDPAYSRPEDRVTTKYNQIELGTERLDGVTEIALSDFFVANWWVTMTKVSPGRSHPQFDNVVVFEIQTGSQAPPGDYRFHLHRIELSGRGTLSKYWYQGILAVWLAAAIIYLGLSAVWQASELNKRRQRTRELEELNAALDSRGRQLEAQAKKDALTGAFNRQGIEVAMSQGLAEFRRQKKPLSIVIFDVDHFKQINDTHGHAVGDCVLKAIAERVHASVRSHDQLARWGGEEFILVCRNTPLNNAVQMAEKLRKRIADDPFDRGLSVTASFGVAQLSSGERPDQLFERADRALYAAKNQGRNRVVQADP